MNGVKANGTDVLKFNEKGEPVLIQSTIRKIFISANDGLFMTKALRK